jgi:thiol:disulfide interchange protein
LKVKYLIPFCSFLLFCIAAPLTASSSSFTSSPPISAVSAQESALEQKSPVQVNLLTEEHSILPGKKFWVGIDVKLEEGWDTYWINPGDSGFPINVKWNLPEGFQVSSLQWPYPEKFTSQSLVGFGYTHSFLLLAEVTPSEQLPLDKDIKISADVSWLACKEQCIPGNAHLDIDLPVKGSAPEKDNTVAAQFLKARQQLPQLLSEKEGTLSFAAKKEELVLNFIPSLNAHTEIVEAFFVPEAQEMIDHGAPQLLKKENKGYFLNVKRANPAKDLPEHVKGVLLISEKGSEIKRAIQVDSMIAPTTATSSDSPLSFEIALVCAFVGGLILNIMPCVLPVISLKIFSFIKMAEEKRREILKQGFLFTAGVLVSFWVLSALLLALRASGESIGWGFQLQEPMFVSILIFVLFLLGLSLFGLFELGTSMIGVGDKLSSKGSFFKSSFMGGVLATLVATPCTGPLLGPALGLAMALPPFSSMLIFTAMGLGMASPYLLISAFPKLIRFLPKPGNWMVVFKQLMGFMMMATCAWLIWVFVGETSHMTLLTLLIALIIFALSAWIFGKWASFAKPKKTRFIATLVALLLIVFSGGATLSSIKNHKAEAAVIAHQTKGWEPFSTEKVEALRKEGKAVFVDFTAKWCLICQANKVTLHSADIQNAFETSNVVTMEADWTKKDALIADELHKLGRSGVPVYVLYPADLSKKPYILPQTLTKTIVQDYLKRLDPSSGTTVYVDR